MSLSFARKARFRDDQDFAVNRYKSSVFLYILLAAFYLLTIMKLVVDYEGEIYDFTWLEGMDTVNFADILGQRIALNCWMEDHVTKVWIRVPRIEILRLIMKEVPVDISVRLRFQASSESPNTTPHLTPTKKTIDVVTQIESEKDPGTTWALSVANNVIESFTRLPVAEIDINELVVVRESADMFAPRLSLSSEALLQAVRSDAEKGINPFEVTVTAEGENGGFQTVKLTRQVWMNCLLRGNSRADLFLDYIAAGFENLFILGERLKKLHSSKDLWLRLKCFHYDLKHFDEQAQSRLENYGGEYYMSNRYFSQEELTYLLNFPTASGVTARQTLQDLFTSKSAGTICSSHDVAPAVERIFGIRKGFEKEKGFIDYFKKFVGRKITF
ncbi:hypothetical protein EON65_51125 [archaeon]|nr:MAG: hypothetical protein EON65_51125 [archaeon]